MNKTQEEMQRQFQQQQQQQQYQNKQQSSKSHEPVGEYVDYIEIKDDTK
jgi:hypothetical protein